MIAFDFIGEIELLARSTDADLAQKTATIS
jgi:hypothetical protein